MASQSFLKVEGIQGESKDHAHEGAIEVVDWGWAATLTGSMHEPRRGGAEKPEFQDLWVTKAVDLATPQLWSHLATGRQIQSAELIMRRMGGDPVEFLKLRLELIIVSDIVTTGTSEEDHAAEEVSLNFARWKITYTPQEADGTPGPENSFGFDIRRNEQI